MGNFRKLRVWQAAHTLAIETRRVVLRMRGARAANLSDQILRAVMSVPNNIIEGNAHESPKEFVRYLGYALASAWEIEGHLQLAYDFGMVNEEDFEALLVMLIDVRGKLYGLIRTLSGIPRNDRASSPDPVPLSDDPRPSPPDP